MSLEFLVTSLIVVLLPGTGVIYTLTIGLSSGARASIIAALGCTLGIVPHLVASLTGLAALLHTSALAFEIIKYLGVAYLLYMAYAVFTDKSELKLEQKQKQEKRSGFRIIQNGFLLNILNPKLSLFFLAFLPQFVPATAVNPTIDMTILALVFMLMTFVVFVIYGAFAAATRRYVVGKPHVMKWLRASFAAAFGFLGVRLATL